MKTSKHRQGKVYPMIFVIFLLLFQAIYFTLVRQKKKMDIEFIIIPTIKCNTFRPHQKRTIYIHINFY